MILVNLVDINVLMLLWANLSRHLDRCMLRMLRQDISCHLLVSRVQPHAVLVTIKHLPVKLPVMLLMQATMFLAQPNRARLLVLQEPIKQAQVNPRVTMLMQATIFLAQPNRARLLVLQEPLAARPARFLAPMRCQAIMYQFRVNQAQQSV